MERINKNFTSIGDICKDICSGGTPNTSHNEYYENGNIPWVNTNEVNFCNIYDTNKYITEIGLKESSAKFVPINTIIVAMYGVTAGKSAIAKVELTTNQACCNLIIDENKAYYKFVYYWLKLNAKNLNLLANGSAQQNLNSIIIKKYKIPSNWSVIKQKKIADILSCYDELIEKNSRKIAILEEQIQELYKEWFVRFRFPGYETAEFVGGVPKDWKFEKVGERYNITIGKTPPREEANWFTKNEEFSTDWSSIADIRKGMFLQRTSEQLTNEAIDRFHIVKLPKRTILLSFKLTVGLVAITTQEFTTTNEAIAHFICQQSELEYLYMFLKNYDYNRLGNTSSIGNAINSKIIRKMDLVVPTKKVLELFHNKTKCMFDEIEKVQIINSKIEIIRDSLLPRLMSGKLEVKG